MGDEFFSVLVLLGFSLRYQGEVLPYATPVVRPPLSTPTRQRLPLTVIGQVMSIDSPSAMDVQQAAKGFLSRMPCTLHPPCRQSDVASGPQNRQIEAPILRSCWRTIWFCVRRRRASARPPTISGTAMRRISLLSIIHVTGFIGSTGMHEQKRVERGGHHPAAPDTHFFVFQTVVSF